MPSTSGETVSVRMKEELLYMPSSQKAVLEASGESKSVANVTIGVTSFHGRKEQIASIWTR